MTDATEDDNVIALSKAEVVIELTLDQTGLDGFSLSDDSGSELRWSPVIRGASLLRVYSLLLHLFPEADNRFSV
jgi:hypothetical protein